MGTTSIDLFQTLRLSILLLLDSVQENKFFSLGFAFASRVCHFCWQVINDINEYSNADNFNYGNSYWRWWWWYPVPSGARDASEVFSVSDWHVASAVECEVCAFFKRR